MARAKTNKLYRTFTKGLITEASYLTYPEDASIDELNTIISRKGNRTRRVGIDYQSGYVLEDLSITDDKVVNEYVWNSANNDALYNFVVVQVGSLIHFYRMDEGTISAHLQDFTVPLTDFLINGATSEDVEKEFAAFSSGAGFLFIAHSLTSPLVVTYDKTDNDLIITPVIIEVRDLEGIDDGLENDEEPTTLSPEHHYNLLNQGWKGGAGTAVAGSSAPTSAHYLDNIYNGKYPHVF